ncbi:MAG: Type 1 glutamine amidotransferase-like domain-containing protein, partial [Flavobacteriales bacterium]
MNVLRIGWLVLWTISACVAQAQGYALYNTGATEDGDFQASGGVCLMGGASENDEAMAWFLERAGGGDILVLRASGSDGYNDYLYSDLGVNVNRVTTVVCQGISASSNATVLGLIEGAEGIWFAGGDQSDYHNLWQGTPLNDAINEALTERNIVIGGTSAGMAILGGLRFTAANGTVYSEEALEDPYNAYMTLDNTPFIEVPVLANTFTDTH